MLKIIEESIERLACPEAIHLEVQNGLDDESVWLDHDLIVSMLLDLERNALDAMPEGGALRVTTSGNDREVVITISDTGKGIPQESLSLLFTPFFTTKAAGNGTGLGLPSAYATVKAHRGDIKVESNTDARQGPTGATVTIRLPRRQAFQEKKAKVILHEEE